MNPVNNMWDPTPYSLTPAARVLSRCVHSGTISQKELDAVPRKSEVFSSRLLEAEQLNRMKQEIDQVSLDLELLKLEKSAADVTHNHYLSQRFVSLQEFTSHLQDILKEQSSLQQRLMKPNCQQNLPVQANLHRYVVELMGMIVEFIENLEMKIKMVRSIPATGESLINLNSAMTQLLAQVTEVESLTKQVLQRQDQSKEDISDTSNEENSSQKPQI